MSSLTESIRSLCQELVRAHVPYEADCFNEIWSALWQSLGCQSIEELSGSPKWSLEAEPIRVLGAIGGSSGGDIDSLFIIGPIVGVMTALQGGRLVGDITIETIGDTLKNEIVRMNVPDHVRRILFGHGMGMLAELFGVDPDSGKADLSMTTGLLWVEWCNHRAEPFQAPELEADHFDPIEVGKRFRQKRCPFDVLLNHE